MTDKVRRIHFVHGWTEPDDKPGYRCQKCGTQRLTPEGCYEHRKGIITECLQYRIRDWFKKYLPTGSDAE